MQKMSHATCANTPEPASRALQPAHRAASAAWRQAISLAERQLHALRDKIRALELKLAELIRFGEENDDISTKVHRLSVALLQAGSATAVGGACRQPARRLRRAARQPRCGRGRGGWCTRGLRRRRSGCAAIETPPVVRGAESIGMTSWFGEAAPHIRSLALMPLRVGGNSIVCSRSAAPAERFYAGMGTLYLGRIADLAAAALAARAG